VDSYDLLVSEGTKSAICFPVIAAFFTEVTTYSGKKFVLPTEPNIPQLWEYKNGHFKFKPIINHDQAGFTPLIIAGTSDALQMNVDGFIALLSSPTIVDLGLLGSADFHEIKMADFIAEVLLKLNETFFKPVRLTTNFQINGKDVP